jgi:hypothetical protein
VVAPRRPEGGVAPPTVAVETKNVAHAKADRLVGRVIILIGYARWQDEGEKQGAQSGIL